MKSNNALKIDNLRIEIAILQEDIDSRTQQLGKFKIPTVMINEKKGIIHTPSNNIRNTSSAISKSSSIKFNDHINLIVPYYLRIFYGKPKIPKGTKFLVSFTAGNINDGRIIGFYDQEFYQNYVYNYEQLENKIAEMISMINRHSNDLSSLFGKHDESKSYKEIKNKPEG